MSDLIVVCHFQSRGYLNRYAGSFLDCEPAFPLDIFLQCDAFHQLHDNIIDPVFIAHIVDIHDVGMGKACRRLRFFFEFLDKSAVVPVFFL